MGQNLYFRRGRNGLPLAGSNIRANRRPSTGHIQVKNVINGPISDSFKPAFAGNNRFFVQLDANGNVINGSLVVSTIVPVGNYMELFKDNVIGRPRGENENSGVVVDSPEDLADVPMIMSEDFRINGYRTSKIV
jgi:hypothetical protein